MPSRRPVRRSPRRLARRSKAERRPPTPAPRHSLVEPPHGHIVCRGCGRIHPLAFQASDTEVLLRLTARGPEGWAVERVAYSLAAVCPKCRHAGPAS